MEVPAELKILYAHWQKHTRFDQVLPAVDINTEVLQDMIAFATKRMQVWERKDQGEAKPYSADPILQKYRFCNIYRELDRQTIEIHQDIARLKGDFDLWLLNLAFQRFICRPDTVQQVGQLSFNLVENQRVAAKLREMPSPKYGTAYVFPISAIQRGPYPTREEFFCLYLPKIISTVSKVIHNFQSLSVVSALQKILPVFGYNFKFHWTEILIDVAYQFPERIDLSRDFHIGPGALPTLQKLAQNSELNDVLNMLANLRLPDFPYLTLNGENVQLSAENWEGISCEYRKYTNLWRGKGRKRRF